MKKNPPTEMELPQKRKHTDQKTTRKKFQRIETTQQIKAANQVHFREKGTGVVEPQRHKGTKTQRHKDTKTQRHKENRDKIIDDKMLVQKSYAGTK